VEIEEVLVYFLLQTHLTKMIFVMVEGKEDTTAFAAAWGRRIEFLRFFEKSFKHDVILNKN